MCGFQIASFYPGNICDGNRVVERLIKAGQSRILSGLSPGRLKRKHCPLESSTYVYFRECYKEGHI